MENEEKKQQQAENSKAGTAESRLTRFRTACTAISCVMLAVITVFTVKSAGHIKAIFAIKQNQPSSTKAMEIFVETTAESRDILLFTEPKTETETAAPDKNGTTDYVINKSSKKIHLANCSFAEKMKAENRQEVQLSPEELEEYFTNGYSPCSSCLGGEK